MMELEGFCPSGTSMVSPKHSVFCPLTLRRGTIMTNGPIIVVVFVARVTFPHWRIRSTDGNIIEYDSKDESNSLPFVR